MSIFGFTSLDALQVSIEGRLGGDEANPPSRDEVSPVVAELLAGEVHANEQRIAALRLVLSLVYAALAVVVRATDGDSISTMAVVAAIVWSGASLCFYAAMRRAWNPSSYRRVIPVSDGLAIVVGAALTGRTNHEIHEAHTALAGNVSLLCALLVFAGALRLTRVATLISSAIAVAAFLVVAISAQMRFIPAIGIIAGLIALSALASGVTDGVRRVIAMEVRRLAMERHVERANAQAAEAQAASTAREEVLRIVAHDLRNPLGTLLMAADLLGEPTISDDLREKTAEVVKRTGSRMNRLIHDLLNVARMDTGRLSVETRPVAPEQLLANALELMRPLAIRKSVTLNEEYVPGLPKVDADPGRIGQVFSNLIGNAIKFTPPGGTITARAEDGHGRVWFSVSDTGPGIPPEQLNKVFGEFWQARKTDNRGIGLGLTIAKGIVEAHGGTIGVSSEVGVGTRFWFGLNSVQ